VWQTPAIDPELGLLYFSTGNAGPDYNGAVRPGDNLFTVSVLALDIKTGEYRWHYQMVHHDIWDYDTPRAPNLFDAVVDGRPRKIGVFEQAHNGTLFLDDVADMPRESQSRILRVLVEQRFRRVGGEQDVQVDVRVVTSTSRDLKTEIAEGRFREDLFHRLNVVPIRVPALSERREDIAELVDYFVETISASQGLPRRVVGEDAVEGEVVVKWREKAIMRREIKPRIRVKVAGMGCGALGGRLVYCICISET
jgi:hypothetical protein